MIEINPSLCDTELIRNALKTYCQNTCPDVFPPGKELENGRMADGLLP